MPRNAAGIYSLPDPPVVTNTTIESLDENVTRDDIAAELSNSLDRNGRGPMLAPLRVPDGDMAVPAYSWTLEANSGWYRAGVNDFRFSIGGADVLKLLPTGIVPVVPIGPITVTGPLSLDPGTIAAPGLSFVGGPDTGWYGPGPGVWTWVQGGVEVFDLRGNTIQSLIQHRFYDGIPANPAISWIGEPASGFYRAGAANFGFAIGGVPAFGFTAGEFSTAPGIGALIQGLVTATFGASFTGGDVNLSGAPLSFRGPRFVATGPGSAPFQADTLQVHNQGLFKIGNAVGAFGSMYHYTAAVDGTSKIFQSFVPNQPDGTGQHSFAALQGDSNSRLSIYGGAYGAGAGSSLNTYYTAVQIGGISVNLADGTPGSQKSIMYFGAIRNGAFTGTDMALTYNYLHKAQLKIYGGWDYNLGAPEGAIMVVQGNNPTGDAPSLCLHGGDSAWVLAQSANQLYMAGAGGGGPIAPGWAFVINAAGAAQAASFTPVSDLSLKSDVHTIQNALHDVLKLRGVRYRQTWDARPSLGLVADEVAQVFPELVGTVSAPHREGYPDMPLKTLNYNALIGPMIEALREVNDRLTALEH